MGWPRLTPEPRPEPVEGVTREEFEQRMADLEAMTETLRVTEARLRATVEDAKRVTKQLDNSVAAAAARQRRLQQGGR